LPYIVFGENKNKQYAMENQSSFPGTKLSTPLLPLLYDVLHPVKNDLYHMQIGNMAPIATTQAQPNKTIV
jgi:hypothetical protein